MNRTHTRIVALAVFSAVGLLWLWSGGPDAPSPADGAPQAVAPSTRSVTSSAHEAAPELATSGPEGVEAALVAWRDLHAPVGYLSQEDTEALIARREAAAAALAGAIARLDGEEMPAVVEAFHDAQRSRDKLVIIEGLGQNASPEALAALQEIYGAEGSYTLRSNVIRALGDSPAAGHHELLVEQMWSAGDERLQQLSAQGLYGESVASGELIEAVYSELPIKVRLEAIHSLGATGTESARAALEGFSQDEALEARVRQYAEQELERSFG